MKFKIKVSDDISVWEEELEKNITNPRKYAEDMIKMFNNTLRPGEKPRTLLDVEILGDPENEELHNWQKRTDGMSVNFRGYTVDIMYCEKCHVTGKRFGMTTRVILDSKYRKKVFRKCNTSIEYLKKV